MSESQGEVTAPGQGCHPTPGPAVWCDHAKQHFTLFSCFRNICTGPKVFQLNTKGKTATKLVLSQPKSFVCPQNKTYGCHMRGFVCSTFSLHARGVNLGRFWK